MSKPFSLLALYISYIFTTSKFSAAIIFITGEKLACWGPEFPAFSDQPDLARCFQVGGGSWKGSITPKANLLWILQAVWCCRLSMTISTNLKMGGRWLSRKGRSSTLCTKPMRIGGRWSGSASPSRRGPSLSQHPMWLKWPMMKEQAYSKMSSCILASIQKRMEVQVSCFLKFKGLNQDWATLTTGVGTLKQLYSISGVPPTTIAEHWMHNSHNFGVETCIKNAVYLGAQISWFQRKNAIPLQISQVKHRKWPVFVTHCNSDIHKWTSMLELQETETAPDGSKEL